MMTIALNIALVLIALSMLICFIRIIIGPTMADRIIALDAIGINMIGVIGIVAMMQQTMAYTEVLLVIGILSLIGAIALSKFLQRGTVIDRDHD